MRQRSLNPKDPKTTRRENTEESNRKPYFEKGKPHVTTNDEPHINPEQNPSSPKPSTLNHLGDLRSVQRRSLQKLSRVLSKKVRNRGVLLEMNFVGGTCQDKVSSLDKVTKDIYEGLESKGCVLFLLELHNLRA